MDERRFHRLPLPYHYTLSLAWAARTVATRPGLETLIDELGGLKI